MSVSSFCIQFKYHFQSVFHDIESFHLYLNLRKGKLSSQGIQVYSKRYTVNNSSCLLRKKVSLLIRPCGLLRSKSICKFRLKLKSISFKLAMGISYTLNSKKKKIYHSKGDTDLRLSISHGIITIQ